MTKVIDQIQEKINHQQQKLEQLRARKKLLEARYAADSRKIENRRKILAGAVMLKAVEMGKISTTEFLQLMDQGLTREVDRRLFFPNIAEVHTALREDS
ncbi:hypothetical protein [uncultured Herbaspirillum sp.]|uniref:hypothetical protein n=1 Tax=uncultured Herbaspirillum sp. TaxID=160236 RepID=UPI00258E656B|nr:hypothetical protein [uncultured Herbaspirillum sp.]